MIKILLFLALLSMDVLNPTIEGKNHPDACFYDAQCVAIPCYVPWCHVPSGTCYMIPNCA